MTNYPPSYPPGSQPPPHSSGQPSFPFPAQPGTPQAGQPHPSFPFPSQQQATPAAPANFPDAASFSTSSYYSQPQPEPAKKSRARLVLILVAVVMFVAAGVLAGFYVAADSAREKATTTLQDKKAELSDLRGQVSAAEEAKSTAEQNNSDLETKNSALQPCVDATQRWLWDGLEGAERDAAVDAMFAACGG